MKSLLLITLFSLSLNLENINQDNLKVNVCGIESGGITRFQLTTCGLLISDTTNYSIETYSIKWNKGKDTTEMPVHHQIPEEYFELINNINPGSIFHINDIAVLNKKNGQIEFLPSLKFIIKK